MSDALSQIPQAVAAASILLTVYYLGRRGQGRPRSESWPGRRPAQRARVKRKCYRSPTYPVVDGGYYDGLSLAKAAALVENPRARSRLAKLSAHLVESALR